MKVNELSQALAVVSGAGSMIAYALKWISFESSVVFLLWAIVLTIASIQNDN